MEIKIGVTGSSGFIGKHLVSALRGRKNVKISCFDLPKNNLFDLNSVRKFVAIQDIIVHAAAVNRGSDSEIIAGNVIATYNLISAAIKRSGKKTKLIFLSSTQVKTDTVYGLSKKLAEIMLQDFSRKHKTPITIFRLTNIFGEGCRPFYNSVVATFCHQVANGKKLTISNSGQKIKFIYIRDAVKLILKEISVQRKQPFCLKRVSSSNIITVRDLVRLIKSFKKPKASQRLKSKFHQDLYHTYLKQ